MNWKPIETAPKDGELVVIAKLNLILAIVEWGHLSYWCEDWFLPFDSDADESGQPFLGEDEQPTHWMPLPQPPKIV